LTDIVLAFPKDVRIEDPAYLVLVRELPCCGCGQHTGARPWIPGRPRIIVRAHHVTGSGLALKDHDRNTMPLCDGCHNAFHDNRDQFATWDKEIKKEWQRVMVEFTQRLLGLEGVF
jgi:CDGSH-type Zn-finger protein